MATLLRYMVVFPGAGKNVKAPDSISSLKEKANKIHRAIFINVQKYQFNK